MARGGTTGKMSGVQPRISVLDPGQLEQLHQYSLRILSTCGVRVDSERARGLFAQATGAALVDGDRVRIPRELVDWALRAAPSSVDVYNRRAEFAFRLPDQARFGIGVTSLQYQDPESGQVVPFARKHMESMVRLGHSLPSFDVVSTVGIVQDVPPHESDLYATLDMVANTDKPLVLLISDEGAFPGVLDLLETLCGDLAPFPFVIPYLNPISPLVINRGTVSKMFHAAKRGLPFIYSNYGMAGASTPITPASALALLTAELLAGLTLSQLIREGTPVILGSLPAFFDMRGMGSFYDPRSYLMDLACAEMMAYYQLPHCGTSGSGMGWGPDLISAGHQWFNHLFSCIGKVGLAPFVGDVLGSKAFSPAVVVYANEVIEQARIFARGFTLEEESVALEDVLEVGPGGSFLTSNLTLQHFRNASFVSELFPTLTLEKWQEQGAPEAGELVQQYTRRLLDSLEPLRDHAELMARGEEFVKERVL
ncbi:MAG: trimethylamine methyltransferase family protein [Anaerolineae bacterium]